MYRRTTGSGVCISAPDTHFELFPSGRVKSLTEIFFSCTFCVVIRGFETYSDPPTADFLLHKSSRNEPGRGEPDRHRAGEAADIRSVWTEAGGAAGSVRTALGRVRKSKAFSRSTGRSERESRWKSTFLLPGTGSDEPCCLRDRLHDRCCLCHG